MESIRDRRRTFTHYLVQTSSSNEHYLVASRVELLEPVAIGCRTVTSLFPRQSYSSFPGLSASDDLSVLGPQG